MRTCNGCGGRVGIDCFNPIECEGIAMSQQQAAYNDASSDIYHLQQYVNMLEERIKYLEEITQSLRPI